MAVTKRTIVTVSTAKGGHDFSRAETKVARSATREGSGENLSGFPREVTSH